LDVYVDVLERCRAKEGRGEGVELGKEGKVFDRENGLGVVRFRLGDLMETPVDKMGIE
jgi:hypothetical protein